MKQFKCYISGAITNEPHYEFYFHCAEHIVSKMGYKPVQPCFNSPFLGIKCWLCYMIVDLWTLPFCPTIYFMRNWTESKGARVEHAWAKLLRKKIIYETKQDEQQKAVML